MSDRRIPVALAVNGTAVAVTLLLLWALAPAALPEAAVGAAERLALAARLSVWPALLVLALVLLVMAARGAGRLLNPIDDAESRFYRVAQRALSNSVEQTLVFLPGLWALATLLPAAELGWPVLLVRAFLTARLLFVAGYLVHPYARAPGMAATLTVSIVTVGWAAWLAA